MTKIAFHTLGCKVNQVETEQMIEQFSGRGYQVVDFGTPADVYVINTCTVTHVSDRKSRAMLRRAVRNNPQALVVATGCVAQVDAEQLARIEGIGLVIGNQDKDCLVDRVHDYLVCGQLGRSASICPSQGLAPVIFTHPHQRTRAFIKIQDGCQSFCSYCIVPLARGPVRSKAPADVLAEIGQLLRLGYREIVLTGIHTGMYGVDLLDWNLTRLLEYLLANSIGDFRIRLSSIEPLELNNELLTLIARNRKICRHFHIPLQSGSDRILTSMRRRYDRDYYRQLVLETAAQIPGAVFTADVMVGYPTENADDFQSTYDLIQELPLYELHVFKYSQRAGTLAAAMEPQVEATIKQQRSEILLALGRSKKQDILQSQVGKELAVLVERHLSGEIYLGLSDNYVEVQITSPQDLVGQMVKICMTEAGPDCGFGTLIDSI